MGACCSHTNACGSAGVHGVCAAHRARQVGRATCLCGPDTGRRRGVHSGRAHSGQRAQSRVAGCVVYFKGYVMEGDMGLCMTQSHPRLCVRCTCARVLSVAFLCMSRLYPLSSKHPCCSVFEVCMDFACVLGAKWWVFDAQALTTARCGHCLSPGLGVAVPQFPGQCKNRGAFMLISWRVKVSCEM